MATAHQDYVVGVVCRHRLSDLPGLIHMTPGTVCLTICMYVCVYVCIIVT